MDIIQSNKSSKRFSTNYNNSKIVINLIEGGKHLYCNIVINDIILSKMDLYTANSISKNYTDDLVESFGDIIFAVIVTITS